MVNLIFVTGNEGKFREARAIIPELTQLDLDLTEVQGIDSREIIRHKLEEARKQVKGNLIVEDVSLGFNCLKGLPGPLIKWFLKTMGCDGLAEITKKLEDNDAEVIISLGFSNETGETEFFEFSRKGKIVSPRGENGFGWDPVFQPEGLDKTFAEMTYEEKNKVSHRGEVFRLLKEYLKTK